MNDDERTERRLRATLRHHAEQVDSQLSGPDLRRRATTGDETTNRVRRLAPAIAAAAAVVVIATVGAVVATHDSPDNVPSSPAPIQPGGRTVPASDPAPSSSTDSSPATTSAQRRPTPVRPSGSPSPSTSPRSVPAVLPTSTPTATPGRRTLLPGRASSLPTGRTSSP